jgi:hypothetical protein
MRRNLNAVPAEPKAELEAAEKERDDVAGAESRTRQLRSQLESQPESVAVTTPTAALAEDAAVGGFLDETSANQPRKDSPAASGLIGIAEFGEKAGESQASNERFDTIGKLSDLKLDAELQKKSESVEEEQRLETGRTYAPSRAKRAKSIRSSSACSTAVISSSSGTSGARASAMSRDYLSTRTRLYPVQSKGRFTIRPSRRCPT